MHAWRVGRRASARVRARAAAQRGRMPKQRVAIARAFVGAPPILFADEPTGNLDQETGRVVEEVLFELQRETNTTVILVTHDLELAEKADRVLVMSGGRLRERS